MDCSNRSCQECSPTMPESRVLKPFITIVRGNDAYIFIGRDTVRALKGPQYITMLVNWDVPSVAIMECGPTDNMSFKVPDFYRGSHCFRIYCKSFIARLSEITGLSFEKHLRLQGVLDAENKAVIFSFPNGNEAAEKQNIPSKEEDSNDKNR